jgi:hypothetical protein
VEFLRNAAGYLRIVGLVSIILSFHVWIVQQIPLRPLAAHQSLIVFVMKGWPVAVVARVRIAEQGTRRKMERRVSRVAKTIINKTREHLLVYPAHQTLYLRLPASLKPHVSAWKGMREQMERRVHSAASTNTKQESGRILAPIVR